MKKSVLLVVLFSIATCFSRGNHLEKLTLNLIELEKEWGLVEQGLSKKITESKDSEIEGINEIIAQLQSCQEELEEKIEELEQEIEEILVQEIIEKKLEKLRQKAKTNIKIQSSFTNSRDRLKGARRNRGRSPKKIYKEKIKRRESASRKEKINSKNIRDLVKKEDRDAVTATDRNRYKKEIAVVKKKPTNQIKR